MRLLPLFALPAMDRAAVAPRPPRPIELRGPATTPAGPSSAPGRDHPTVLRYDAPPEVRGVELNAPDRLVYGSQLGHGERRSHERRCDARDLELDADAVDRVAHDPAVIERQVDLFVEHLGYRDEGGVCCIRARHHGPHVAKHCEVRDRHDVQSRVALGIAVSTELGEQARDVDASLLDQLPLRRLVQRLGWTLEAARDRPYPLEWRLPTTHEQYMKQAFGHGQDHHVHRHRERRELRRVVAERRVPTSGFGRHATLTRRVTFRGVSNVGMSSLLTRRAGHA